MKQQETETLAVVRAQHNNQTHSSPPFNSSNEIEEAYNQQQNATYANAHANPKCLNHSTYQPTALECVQFGYLDVQTL